MKRAKLLSVMLLIIFISSQTIQAFHIGPIPFSHKVKNYRTPNSYDWIWDEFSNAPGPINGEDFVYWGPSLGPYHNYTELTSKLLALNSSFSDIVDVFSIGSSRLNRTLWAVRLTNETITTAKTEYYIVAAHHAREMITVEDALYFIDWIVFNAEYGTQYHELLAQAEIYVIPMLNPDGISILHWYPPQRKNMAPIDDDNDGTLADEKEIQYVWNSEANTSEVKEEDLDDDGGVGNDLPGGVDLNRNYGAFWGLPGASPNPRDCIYRGEKPFSEPETQAMRDFMYNHSFNYAISLHSGIKAIIAPWSINDTLPLRDNAEFNAALIKLKEILGFPLWNETGSGYVTSGEWGDYSLLYHGIKPFTIETYGTYSFSYYYDSFNPSADKVISNCEMIFPALDFLASNPELSYNNSFPSVRVIDPNKINQVFDNYSINWIATDKENDPLNISIFISEDGLHWNNIANNLHDTFSFTWDVTNVPSGSYYIKVAVSDGHNWIHDTSAIKLNVKKEVNHKTNPILFWIFAGTFGMLALLYYIYIAKKSKDVGKMWSKNGKN